MLQHDMHAKKSALHDLINMLHGLMSQHEGAEKAAGMPDDESMKDEAPEMADAAKSIENRVMGEHQDTGEGDSDLAEYKKKYMQSSNKIPMKKGMNVMAVASTKKSPSFGPKPSSKMKRYG